MFAYCNNNPVNEADKNGCSPFGSLNIVDYAVIHALVQAIISYTKGWEMEVGVIDSAGNRGRLDLYDRKNRAFYEVKSSKYYYGKGNRATLLQIERYMNTAEFSKGEYYGPIFPGTETVEGCFDYGNYHVEYYSSNVPGLILYDVKPIKKELQIDPVVAPEPEVFRNPQILFLPIPAFGSYGSGGVYGGLPGNGQNIFGGQFPWSMQPA